MSRKKRVYEDDDGRTIADMSDVSAPSMFVPKTMPQSRRENQPRQEKASRPWEDSGYTAKERFLVAMGALKAALLIAMAFIVGLGAFVLLLYVLA